MEEDALRRRVRGPWSRGLGVLLATVLMAAAVHRIIAGAGARLPGWLEWTMLSLGGCWPLAAYFGLRRGPTSRGWGATWLRVVAMVVLAQLAVGLVAGGIWGDHLTEALWILGLLVPLVTLWMALTALPLAHWWRPVVAEGRAVGVWVAGAAGILGPLAAAVMTLVQPLWIGLGIGMVSMAMVFVAMAWAVRPPATPVEGPVRESGRLFGHDWVGDTAGAHWVSRDEAARWRSEVADQPVPSTLSGFELLVLPSHMPFSTTALSLRSVAIGLFPSFVAWSTVGVAGMLAVAEGSVDAVLWGWAFGVVAYLLWMLVLALPMMVGAAVMRLAAVTWIMARDGGAVERVGRRLRTPRGDFTLGEVGQEVNLSWGWRGARLELVNPRERVVLHGDHGRMSWLADNVRGVQPRGDTRDVPEALQRVVARATERP